MPATLIRTATDFRTVLAFHDYAVWNLTHFTPDCEPRVREQLEYIFQDLKYLEQGDSDQMAVFLEAVGDPLDRLWHLGCAIIALVTRGTMRLQGGTEISDWIRTHYFIVPRDGCFRIGDDLATTIHHFNPDCDDAVQALHQAASGGLSVSSWIDRKAVTVDYEGRVPWCEKCYVQGFAGRG